MRRRLIYCVIFTVAVASGLWAGTWVARLKTSDTYQHVIASTSTTAMPTEHSQPGTLHGELSRDFATQVLAACQDLSLPGRLTIRYPLDEAIFPPDIVAPTFDWQDYHTQTNAWLVAFDFRDGSTPASFPCNRQEWTPSDEDWEVIKQRSQDRLTKVTILGVDRAEPSRILSGAEIEVSTSLDEVGAPLFFREVNLPFGEAVKDPAKYIRWRFGPISSKQPPPIVLENLPVCGNCHSFSADGSTFAMEVDAGNDKGSYTVAPIEKEIVLDPTKIITWADYRREDGEPTFGMLCQVSPDGRYVVGTVKDRVLAVNQPQLAFSQLFFTVKGILAIYDRQRDTFSALPGADDPEVVQTNATWSPDGKYIVFARSRSGVYNPPELQGLDTVSVPPKAAREFVSGGRKFLFDLYRVPFNNGQGGKAEPIAGASNNGMSNYFAKYSPEGQWIVFCKAKSFMLLQPDSELYIIPAEGGEARRLGCNTRRMNSWHSWSPNGRWLVFSSKANSPYTQLFLTHIDQQGKSSPPVVLSRFTQERRAANIPEFVNADPTAITKISAQFVDDLSFCRAAGPYLANNDREGAARQFRKALAINPRNLQALLEVGIYLLDQGQLDEAKILLTRAAEDADTSNVKPGMLSAALAKAHANLGVLQGRAGNLKEAVQHSREALRLEPGYAFAHCTLGAALLDLNQVEEGKKHLAESLRIDPRDAVANCRYADLLRKDDQPQQAVRHYEQALQQDAEFLPALLGLASIRATSPRPDLRDGDVALAFATTACERTQYQDARALDMLAAAHAELGHFAEALRFVEDAHRLAEARRDDALASVLQQHRQLYLQSQPLRSDTGA